ncbi:hypothetical protein C2G38_2174476 [Gigaspora rosea]|uniref:Uncharacterized protein n=1 Tax=Gigaspora rosea TaxID=44941 RepID=A0A397VIE1_9GLOM|nr:hypothetical protein C2G38_2174476 [Gigaspora rosea]
MSVILLIFFNKKDIRFFAVLIEYLATSNEGFAYIFNINSSNLNAIFNNINTIFNGSGK